MAITADSIKALLITVGFDSQEVQDGVKNLDKQVQASINKIGRAIAGFFGVAAIRGMVRNFAALSEEVGRTAQRIGIGANELNTWQLAVERAGGSSEGLTSTLQKLSDQLRQVSIWGRGEVVYSFGRLGISVRDANGNLRTSTELLTELSGLAERIGSARFITIAERMGIDRATIDLLLQGREAVQASLQELSGMAVEDGDVKVAMDFNRAWLALSRTVERFAAIFIRRILPVFTKGINTVTEWINVLRRNQPFLISFITVLAGLIAVSLVPALISAAKWGWRALAPFLPFLLILGGLSLLLEDFWSYLNGGPSELEALWQAFGTSEEIIGEASAAFRNMKDDVLALAEALKVLSPYLGDYLRETGSASIDILGSIIRILKAIFTVDFPALFDGLVSLVVAAYRQMMAPGEAIARFLVETFGKAFRQIGDYIYDTLREAVAAAAQAVKDILSFIGDALSPSSVVDWVKGKVPPLARATGQINAMAPGAPGNASLANSGLMGQTNIDNRSNTETVVNVGGIEINSQSGDPLAITNTLLPQLGRYVNNSSRGVRK